MKHGVFSRRNYTFKSGLLGGLHQGYGSLNLPVHSIGQAISFRADEGGISQHHGYRFIARFDTEILGVSGGISNALLVNAGDSLYLSKRS